MLFPFTKRDKMSEDPKPHPPSEYFKVRLEHTLKHTQESTRLIYLVNGGALGALYFFAKMGELATHKKEVVFVVLAILTVINFLHACLLIRQGQWYSDIDSAFASSCKAIKVERRPGFPFLGTHHIYASIHLVLTAALLGAAIAALCVTLPPQNLDSAVTRTESP